MTIKTECVIKHLKHDYKEIGKVVGFVVAAIVVIAGGVYTLVNAGSILNWLASHLHAIPFPSAYLVLNVIAAIAVLSFTVGVAVFGTQKSFTYKSVTSEYDHAVVNKENGSDFFMIMAGLCAAPFYLFYAIVWSLSNDMWESPVTSAIIFFVLILIGTPIGCAIARCKE